LIARGEPYQFLAVHYDITDRKRAQEQLREQTVLAQIAEMAAIVAHEVKNPLVEIDTVEGAGLGLRVPLLVFGAILRPIGVAVRCWGKITGC
jgi:hypothetical protein